MSDRPRFPLCRKFIRYSSAALLVISAGVVSSPASVVHAVTTPPTLTTPTSSSSFDLKPGEATPSVFTLNATFPNTVLAGSVRVILTMTNDSNVSRIITATNSQKINGTFDPLAPAATISALPWVVSVTTTVFGLSSTARMPDGSYTVAVSYQNSAGDPAATASASASSVTFNSLSTPTTASRPNRVHSLLSIRF